MSFIRGVEKVVVDDRILDKRSMVTQKTCSLATGRFHELLTHDFVIVLDPGVRISIFVFIRLSIIHRIVIEAGCPADQIVASRQVKLFRNLRLAFNADHPRTPREIAPGHQSQPGVGLIRQGLFMNFAVIDVVRGFIRFDGQFHQAPVAEFNLGFNFRTLPTAGKITQIDNFARVLCTDPVCVIHQSRFAPAVCGKLGFDGKRAP